MDAIEVGCCPICNHVVSKVDEIVDVERKFQCGECGTLYENWNEAEECCPNEEETQIKE
jgi:hypothetical protein